MNFLNKIFTKKQELICTNDDFWIWFATNEKDFYNAVKTGTKVEDSFLKLVYPKLRELHDGFYCLTGMTDNNTVEFVVTPDGEIKNIVFVEEFIESAPTLSGWNFIALKPPVNKSIGVQMEGYIFDNSKLSFYAIDHKDYPDEVDLVVVYDDYIQEDASIITNGIYVFLDNYLGELNSLTAIDGLTVIGKTAAEQDLISIEKLNDYLIWREKEYIEKYEGVRYCTDQDRYSSLEATLDNGNPLLAIVNTTLLQWDSKSSHPWILKITISYDGTDTHGMPDHKVYQQLDDFEEEVMVDLIDCKGYLNVAMQTADNQRIIYFACKEYRFSSKVLHALQKKHQRELDVSYTIYKDKYWQSLECFAAAN